MLTEWLPQILTLVATSRRMPVGSGGKPTIASIVPEAVSAMAKDAIVFACANPVPEIDPAEARAAGARIVATGRSDFANQVNYSLAFPGIFRGVLDVRAAKITDGMTRAAAIAAATAMAAQEEGVAGLSISRDRLRNMALERIRAARAATSALAAKGLVSTSDEVEAVGRD